MKAASCACGRDPAQASPSFEIVGCDSSLPAGIPHAFLLHGDSCSQSHPNLGLRDRGSAPADPQIPRAWLSGSFLLYM